MLQTLWPVAFIAAVSLGCAPIVPRPDVQSSSPVSDTRYLLPFPVGDSAKLIQGNNGPYGHQGHAQHAFDFIRPLRSPVTAARSGRIVAVEGRYVDGNRTPGQENFVVVLHDDSTFGRYYHLTQSGAAVAPGVRVVAGQVIGHSGNTGASAGPHLHFDVTRGCFAWGCQTVTLRFSNAGSDTLVAGRTYYASAY